MGGNRRERIARIIREEASRVILHDLADPRIGFCTVTRVQVTGDLHEAVIYVSIMGEELDRKHTMKALARAASVVRRAIAPRLKTRLLPSVSFDFDESVSGAIHMSELINAARNTDADKVRANKEASSSSEVDEEQDDTTQAT